MYQITLVITARTWHKVKHELSAKKLCLKLFQKPSPQPAGMLSFYQLPKHNKSADNSSLYFYSKASFNRMKYLKNISKLKIS